MTQSSHPAGDTRPTVISSPAAAPLRPRWPLPAPAAQQAGPAPRVCLGKPPLTLWGGAGRSRGALPHASPVCFTVHWWTLRLTGRGAGPTQGSSSTTAQPSPTGPGTWSALPKYLLSERVTLALGEFQSLHLARAPHLRRRACDSATRVPAADQPRGRRALPLPSRELPTAPACWPGQDQLRGRKDVISGPGSPHPAC